MDDAFPFFAIGVALAVWIFSAVIVNNERRACEDRGGVLVEGVFWYECVAKPEGAKP